MINSAPTFSGRLGKITSNAGYRDEGRSVIFLEDGRFLVGAFVTPLSQTSGTDFAVLRYLADGTLDQTFGSNGAVSVDIQGSNDYLNALLLQSDGKLILAGHGGLYGNYPAFVRINPDGTLDKSFGIDGKVTLAQQKIAYSTQLQPDGKILVALSDGTFVRLNQDGSVDTLFGTTGVATVDQVGTDTIAFSMMALQPDGSVLTAGSFYNERGEWAGFKIARLSAEGQWDRSFGNAGFADGNFGDGATSITFCLLEGDGKFLIGGSSYKNNAGSFALARFNANGSVDASFGTNGKVTTSFPPGDSIGFSGVLQADGKIIVAGCGYDGVANAFAIVRYTSAGQLDQTFGIGGKVLTSFESDIAAAYAVRVQADGKIVVVGYSGANEDSDIALARYLPDGSLDTSFGPIIDTLNGDVNYFENGAAIILDRSVSINDADVPIAGNFANASLTISRTGNPIETDVFVSAQGGTLTSLIEGRYFAVDGVTIGTVLKNSQGVLSLKFATTATPSLVDRAMHQIAYLSSDDAPDELAELEWVFSDGDPTQPLSARGVTRVHITPVNDTPYIQQNYYFLEVQPTQQLSFQLPANAFIDPDGDQLSYSVTLTDGTALPPWLVFDSAALRLTGVPSAGDLGFMEILIRASDPYGRSATGLAVVSITEVNDPPVGAVWIEGGLVQGNTLLARHSLSDADGLGVISFVWKVNGRIVGAGPALLLSQELVGSQLSVTAEYTDNHGTRETKTSDTTPPVSNVNDPGKATLRMDDAIVAVQLSDDDGLDAVSIRWERSADGESWDTLAKANSDNIDLNGFDEVAYLRAVAQYIDRQGTAETVQSSVIRVAVADLIDGTQGDDIIFAGHGNDKLLLSTGNDTLNGGDGIDFAVTHHRRADYAVTITDNGAELRHASNPAESSLLVGVERIQFADTVWAIDIDGVAGQAYRIYQAAFNRSPDTGGLGFWISVMDRGTSLLQIAQGFIQSTEYQAAYGGLNTSTELVSRYYENILHRAPEAAGLAFWVGVLDRNPDSTAAVLAAISESAENVDWACAGHW